MRRLEEEAERLCHPALTSPLQVDMVGLSQQQQHAIREVLAALETTSTEISNGPGTANARPMVIALNGGPGECHAPLPYPHDLALP
jgi:hypothetical protein